MSLILGTLYVVSMVGLFFIFLWMYKRIHMKLLARREMRGEKPAKEGKETKKPNHKYEISLLPRDSKDEEPMSFSINSYPIVYDTTIRFRAGLSDFILNLSDFKLIKIKELDK